MELSVGTKETETKVAAERRLSRTCTGVVNEFVVHGEVVWVNYIRSRKNATAAVGVVVCKGGMSRELSLI